MENISSINIERTLKELNVDIFKLKPNSEKPVFRICDICKKEEIKKFRYINILGQTKCLSCSNQLNGRNNKDKISKTNKEFFKTHKHPRLGIKHTDEAKRKIVENRKPFKWDDEHKKHFSKINSKEGNPFYGKKHTPETLKKMSESSKRTARRGKDCNFYGKTNQPIRNKYLKKDGTTIWFKSTWEAKIAEYLDINNINWQYELKAYPIIYEFEGETKEGTYTPDFFLDFEIWEIKGYWRKDAFAKFEAFKIQYPEIKIKLIMKQDLRNLRIKL